MHCSTQLIPTFLGSACIEVVRESFAGVSHFAAFRVEWLCQRQTLRSFADLAGNGRGRACWFRYKQDQPSPQKPLMGRYHKIPQPLEDLKGAPQLGRETGSRSRIDAAATANSAEAVPRLLPAALGFLPLCAVPGPAGGLPTGRASIPRRIHPVHPGRGRFL